MNSVTQKGTPHSSPWPEARGILRRWWWKVLLWRTRALFFTILHEG